MLMEGVPHLDLLCQFYNLPTDVASCHICYCPDIVQKTMLFRQQHCYPKVGLHTGMILVQNESVDESYFDYIL
jgi:hypothetical protein